MILNKLPFLIKNLSFLFLVFVNFNVLAQWPALSVPNVQVTSSATTGGDLKDYWASSDGVGGSFSFFTDDRQNPGGNESVYCQRIDRWGNVKFVANGVAIATICTADQDRPKSTDDGSNNAIVSWQDDRSSPGSADDIYAQKIDSNGVVQWAANGVLICSAVGKQDKTWIISDGAGGAIIAWEDARMDVAGGTEDIYAQRINSAGVPQWTANGVVICNAVDRQKEIHMVEDGVGGAILVWRDDRNAGVQDIYAQRVNSAGVVQWTANGVVICNDVNDQNKPRITTDGTIGGGIITWADKRGAGGKEDIYAQRTNAAGIVQWAANGVVICNAVDVQKRPVIASDSYGGAVIAWEDSRTGTEDVYAQRVDSNGTIHWTVNGNVVSNAADVQKRVDISEANNGKVLLVWEDARTGGVEDIYSQVIDTAGTMLGTANGIAVSTAADVQKKPFVFRSGTTDWITIWQDDRNKAVTGNTDWYAQGLNPTIVPVLPIELISFEANLNEDRVDIKWVTASEINNDYFTIEKSKDGKSWEKLLIVSGAGNSNQVLEYYDIDYNPFKGISYYRLKQTDYNGKFAYSNVVPVKFEKSTTNQNINLFPSPINVGGTVHLEFKNINASEMLVILRDLKGSEFYSKVVVNVEDGKLIGLPINMDIPAGVYLITASSENQMYSQKLIVK